MTNEPIVKVVVVDSYHPEYIWSEKTHRGMVDALYKHGYFDNKNQIDALLTNDSVATSKIHLQQFWMDTKRKNTKKEINTTLSVILDKIDAFSPDLIFLGDDNAANLIGNEYIDSDIPVVFWGVNGTPVKYGLIENREKPGHNVTGVYQAGYLLESINFFKKIVPLAKTIAVIADDSKTGRSYLRSIANLEQKQQLPLKIVETFRTNNLEEWKATLLRLQKTTDAFFIFNHNTLKDKSGRPVKQMDVGRWYLNNINIPEVTHPGYHVEEGFLCTADDSGYKQGYEAVQIMVRILKGGEKPATLSPYAPSRGNLMVNTIRAKQLGIKIEDWMGVEELVSTAKALNGLPLKPGQIVESTG